MSKHTFKPLESNLSSGPRFPLLSLRPPPQHRPQPPARRSPGWRRPRPARPPARQAVNQVASFQTPFRSLLDSLGSRGGSITEAAPKSTTCRRNNLAFEQFEPRVLLVCKGPRGKGGGPPISRPETLGSAASVRLLEVRHRRCAMAVLSWGDLSVKHLFKHVPKWLTNHSQRGLLYGRDHPPRFATAP